MIHYQTICIDVTILQDSFSQFFAKWLHIHSGQTHCARAVPAKPIADKRVTYLKSLFFKAKGKTITEKLSLERHITVIPSSLPAAYLLFL